jgi:hypothetical protein
MSVDDLLEKMRVLIHGRPSDVPKILVSVQHQVTVKKRTT